MPKISINNILPALPNSVENNLISQTQYEAYNISPAYSNTSISNFVDLYNPTLCFSMNNLTNKNSTTNYDNNTKILRIRRSSDNLEGDVYQDSGGKVSEFSQIIYTLNSQLNITSLTDFATGTNCFVTKWYNQANNLNGTRNTNDLYSNISSIQPQIWGSSEGLFKMQNSNTAEMRRTSTLGGTLTLTETVYTKDNYSQDFSIFVTKSGIPSNTISESMFYGTNNKELIGVGTGVINLNQNIYDSDNFEVVANINQAVNSSLGTAATNITAATTGIGAQRTQLLDIHEEYTPAATHKRRMHFYGNQHKITLDTASTSTFQPKNTHGFRALPGGNIASNGSHFNFGTRAYFILEYDTLPNVGAYMILRDDAIGATNYDIYATEFNKSTGGNIRLISTTAPSGNPTIEGVTYNYTTITGFFGTYYITTTNFTGTLYPGGSNIINSTTDGQWATYASSGTRRNFTGKEIFGTYYSHPVANSINNEGGYSAAGTTWKVPTMAQLVNLQVAKATTYTIGAGQNNDTHLGFMYQLSDAEYAAAGGVYGRWNRMPLYKTNYIINKLQPFSASTTNRSLVYGRSGISDFIYFNRSVHGTRKEISSNLNKINKIYAEEQ